MYLYLQISYSFFNFFYFFQKRRKRKSDATLLEQTCEVGLGSASGSVFIFDVLVGEIKTHLVWKY